MLKSPDLLLCLVVVGIGSHNVNKSSVTTMVSTWGGYSSGSDDSTSYEMRDDESIPNASRQLNKEVKEGTALYPIKMRDCGSRYNRTLYDVDGNILCSSTGVHLNVYTKVMQEEFDGGRLRLIHHMKEPTYTYFVTSDQQANRFQTHREQGAPSRRVYYAYVDEDVDKKSYEYRKMFIAPNPESGDQKGQDYNKVNQRSQPSSAPNQRILQ